jgi:predicted dehydrogenase
MAHMENKVRGVMGTAKICSEKVISAMFKSGYYQARADGFRSLDKPEKMSKKLGTPKAYDSYEALLAAPQIDAIYNPPLNQARMPLKLAAAQPGKHCLCKKPIAQTASKAAQWR